MKLTDDVIKIVTAGGGVIVSSAKMVDDLVRIASAASAKGVTVIVADAGSKMSNDLVRIAEAGQGHVIFDLRD